MRFVLFPYLLCSLLLPCLHAVKAQTPASQQQARLITKFPFKLLTGGIIIIKAALNNHKDSLNFILDTGSGGISIDSATANYLQLSLKKTDRVIKGIGGERTVSFAFAQTMHLPNLTVKNLDCHINDYDLLSSLYGIPIHGIVGYSLLRRYLVTVNYDSNEIAIYTPGQFKYPRGGYQLQPIFSTIPSVHVTAQEASNAEGLFFFDTGAGLCAMISSALANDSTLLTPKQKMYTTQVEGVGGKQVMQLTVIKGMKLGPYKFKKVPAYIFDDAYNMLNYPNNSGIIGNDILRRFNLVINYPQQQIHIKPNKHFNDPFDYAYTGLNLYLIDHQIIIGDIMKGSPAEAAGLKDGDILVGINNNLSGDIESLKTILQVPKSRVKMIVMRNGTLLQITLHIKSIR